MKYYFKNGENAIVADEFSISSIAKRLNELENGKYDIEYLFHIQSALFVHLDIIFEVEG